MWARPVRFQRVCPLLVATADGLRCSVDTAEVRPFWGRAFRYYGTALGACYLAATLGLFTAFRLIGYPVGYIAVAWPPAWSRIAVARGQYFLDQGAHAIAKNDIKTALFSLSYAHELVPQDYDVSFALASLWQISQPLLSDRLYAQMLAEHPEQNDRTADAWNRALLARGDYAQVKNLAVAQFRYADAIHSGYWMNVLLFATRQTGDNLALRRLLAGPSPLAPQWSKVIETEQLARSGRTAQAVAALDEVWPEATHPYVPYYQARSLLELREPARALDLIAQYGDRMHDDERFALRLDAFAQLGWQTLLDSEVTLLLTPPPTGPVVELLATHLARNPNPAVLERVFARLQASPLVVNRQNQGAFLALFFAAGIAGDWDKMKAMAAVLTGAASASPLALNGFMDFFQGKPPLRPIETLLPALPLSLELTYILLARYSSGHAASG
jgi:hypothetical protein